MATVMSDWQRTAHSSIQWELMRNNIENRENRDWSSTRVHIRSFAIPTVHQKLSLGDKGFHDLVHIIRPFNKQKIQYLIE